jgi:hypothetical protein
LPRGSGDRVALRALDDLATEQQAPYDRSRPVSVQVELALEELMRLAVFNVLVDVEACRGGPRALRVLALGLGHGLEVVEEHGVRGQAGLRLIGYVQRAHLPTVRVRQRAADFVHTLLPGVGGPCT